MDGYVAGRISTMTQIFDPPFDASTHRTGSLIVITGSMFSGKTEELIRRVRRTLYAHRRLRSSSTPSTPARRTPRYGPTTAYRTQHSPSRRAKSF